MKFADEHFKHDDVMHLSFRKHISHKTDKVDKLAEEMWDEVFGLKFQDTLASSAQDLASSVVAKELEVDKVECDMHQGDKVVASAWGFSSHC